MHAPRQPIGPTYKGQALPGNETDWFSETLINNNPHTMCNITEELRNPEIVNATSVLSVLPKTFFVMGPLKTGKIIQSS